MTSSSPFTASRFEYEEKHLFFLPRCVFPQLCQKHPIVLIGSRGTGKTTLLKALHWQERLKNDCLKRALEDSPFSDRCLGVYMKLPDTILSAMERWLKNEEDHLRETFIGLFIDLASIQLIATGASELITVGIVDVSPSDEHRCVEKTLQMCSGSLPSHCGTVHTLLGMARLFGDALATLQHACLSMRDANEVLKQMPVETLGKLGRKVCQQIAKLLSTNTGEKWHFKVCMDEAEVLSDTQLIVLNTYMRLAEWPLFPVAAFVETPKDISTTSRHDLTLSNDDRTIVRLNELKSDGFAELAVGVANVRIQRSLNRHDVSINLEKLLGTLKINALLNDILSKSESAIAHHLLEKAKELQSHPFFTTQANENESQNQVDTLLPIYQAYLIEQKKLTLPKPSEPRWKRRGQDSAEIRKAMVAAYLSICKELSTNVLYASADMLLSLSDNCMRDFLHQLEALYLKSGKSLEEFISSTMPSRKQSEALVAASKAKRDSIPRSEIRVGAKQAGRVIEGLAMLTSIVQTKSSDGSHLRSPERGIMRLTFPQALAQENMTPIKAIVNDAAQAGFLRLKKSEGNVWLFQVHNSLAPAFGFSYRGAYYQCDLLPSDLDNLRQSDTDDDLKTVVKRIASRIQNDPPMPLFESKFNGQ